MNTQNRQDFFLFTCDQKLKWFGYGEWVEEADRILFDYKGYKCLVNRVVAKETDAKEEHYFGGHLCGYVEIPKVHFYCSKEFMFDVDVCLDCHGGITYDEKESHLSRNPDLCTSHWIGFDCGHGGDIVPSMEMFKKLHPVKQSDYMKEIKSEYPNLFKTTYRNAQFCIKECTDIVDQLEHLQTESLNEKVKAENGE
jgi:hypothetical protein